MRHVLLVLAALATFAAPAAAGSPDAGGLFGGQSFRPRVPVSPLGAAVSWFDRSRLQVSASVAVGSGFGGTTNALQTTRLSYQFAAPVWMSVSLGNAFGAQAARSGNSFFLEGFEVGFRPTSNTIIQVQYRDLRSPLQLSQQQGFWAR